MIAAAAYRAFVLPLHQPVAEIFAAHGLEPQRSARLQSRRIASGPREANMRSNDNLPGYSSEIPDPPARHTGSNGRLTRAPDKGHARVTGSGAKRPFIDKQQAIFLDKWFSNRRLRDRLRTGGLRKWQAGAKRCVCFGTSVRKCAGSCGALPSESTVTLRQSRNRPSTNRQYGRE
jgi:hypothetical protein